MGQIKASLRHISVSWIKEFPPAVCILKLAFCHFIKDESGLRLAPAAEQMLLSAFCFEILWII